MSTVGLRKRGTQRVSSGGLTLAAIPLIVAALAACFFLSDAFARPSLACASAASCRRPGSASKLRATRWFLRSVSSAGIFWPSSSIVALSAAISLSSSASSVVSARSSLALRSSSDSAER